ncbi:MAG: MATE family efflux transporter [Clostridia bacterium]|jgi:putative MATE family efflux protein
MEFAFSYKHRETRRDILKLAWPSILEQMLIMLVGMVTTILVGRIGSAAIVAVGMVNMIIFFIQAVFAALSTGATVLVARLTGEEDMAKAKDATRQSLILSVGLSVAITLLCYIFALPILRLFLGKAEQDVFQLAVLFYKVTLISLPFLIINIVVGGAFRGAGDTKTPMYISLIVNVINVILGYFLIFGGSTLKPLGVVGAGLAISVSRAIGTVMILWILYTGNTVIGLSLKDGFSLDMDLIRRIFRVGLPAFLEQVVMQGGFLAMQVLVVSMGTVASAVYQIGNSVNSLAFMPIFGFSLAATTLVGQNLGRGDPDKAEECSLQTLYISVVLISIIGLILFVFARQLASLYSKEAEVIELGSKIIRIYALGEPLLAVMSVISAILRGAGDIQYIMYTSIIGIWTLRVVLSYILHKYFHMGVIGVWIAVIADFTVRAALYWFRFKKGKWKYIRV